MCAGRGVRKDHILEVEGYRALDGTVGHHECFGMNVGNIKLSEEIAELGKREHLWG